MKTDANRRWRSKGVRRVLPNIQRFLARLDLRPQIKTNEFALAAHEHLALSHGRRCPALLAPNRLELRNLLVTIGTRLNKSEIALLAQDDQPPVRHH